MNELQITEYKNIRVLTTQQIAESYGTDSKDVYKSQDVVRHPLVQKIVKAYEEYESKTQNKSRNRSREKRRKS